MSDVTAIQKAIDHAEAQVNSAEQVLALIKTPGFQEIIVDGYITQGTEELLAERVNPDKQSPDALAFNNRKIDAIAIFKGWINNQLRAGEQAEQALKELRPQLDAALEEENVGGEG